MLSPRENLNDGGFMKCIQIELILKKSIWNWQYVKNKIITDIGPWFAHPVWVLWTWNQMHLCDVRAIYRNIGRPVVWWSLYDRFGYNSALFEGQHFPETIKTLKIVKPQRKFDESRGFCQKISSWVACRTLSIQTHAHYFIGTRLLTITQYDKLTFIRIKIY